MTDLRLYSWRASANCLKVRILLAHLGCSYELIETDIFGGDTLTDEYAAKNPARTTPLLELDSEQYLPESNAILWYLADGSPYLPAERRERAFVMRWLLFEHESVQLNIASLRFRLQVGLLDENDERVAIRRRSGDEMLRLLDEHLARHDFLVDGSYTIADISVYSYVHVAPGAGYDLSKYASVCRWLADVEAQDGFVNDLIPVPDSARPGRGLSIYG